MKIKLNFETAANSNTNERFWNKPEGAEAEAEAVGWWSPRPEQVLCDDDFCVDKLSPFGRRRLSVSPEWNIRSHPEDCDFPSTKLKTISLSPYSIKPVKINHFSQTKLNYETYLLRVWMPLRKYSWEKMSSNRSCLWDVEISPPWLVVKRPPEPLLFQSSYRIK